MSSSSALRAAKATTIKSLLKKGQVIHIDPDYLLQIYGDITTGKLPSRPIGARYALCIGEDGEATFWVLLTSSALDFTQKIPDEAKSGSWTKSDRTSYFPPNQIWVATKDMIVEAHFAANNSLAPYKANSVVPRMVTPWPAIPTTYPKSFKPLPRTGPVAPKVMVSAEKPVVFVPPTPVAEDVLMTNLVLGKEEASVPVEEVPAIAESPGHESVPIDWRCWMRGIREDQKLSLRDVADLMALPGTNHSTLHAVETCICNRLLTQKELDRWMEVLCQEALPMEIPVLSMPEQARREAFRSAIQITAALKAQGAAPKPSDPEPAPVEVQEVPIEVPVPVQLQVKQADRQAIVDRAVKILCNYHLSDKEAQDLLKTLEAAALALLWEA